MDETSLYNLLLTLHLPVAYDHFTSPHISPPFIIYRNTDTTTFKADDITFKRINNYIVDLVTDTKDVDMEESIESLFESNFLPYDKEEDYIESERIYQIRYFI